MKFFVPAAESDEQAERVYKSFADFNSALVKDERIWKLSWEHNGEEMFCEVGGPLPSYYGTANEPVLAIFDCDSVYKICTENRGGVRGESVLAGKGWNTHATLFTSNET